MRPVFDEPACVVFGREIAPAEHDLRALWLRARDAGASECAAALRALVEVIALHRERAQTSAVAAGVVDAARSAVGSEPGSDPGTARMMRTMTTRQAADALGTTDRYVRVLASRGAIVGTRDDTGVWRLDADSVDDVARKRAS